MNLKLLNVLQVKRQPLLWTARSSEKIRKTHIKNLLHLGGKQDMKKLKRLFADDRGGEVLEYALIAGLITVAAPGCDLSIWNQGDGPLGPAQFVDVI